MIKIGKYYITRNNPRELLKERAELIDKLNDILIGCYDAFESDLNDDIEILCRKLYKYGYLQKSNGNWATRRI